MRSLLLALSLVLLLVSCENEKKMSSINPVNWKKRTITQPIDTSFTSGSTYLSVYSQIYNLTEEKTHDLTATISMRNTNDTDTVFINKAEYYNTKGNLIRTYFKEPIFLQPMETIEIVIDQTDKEGGTGANFVFEWSKLPNSSEPLFEGVMISTAGTQGLSFTTQGVKIK